MEDIRRRKGKTKGGGIRGGDTPRETMDSGKQTVGFRGQGVGEWDRPVMGIKEGTCCDEYWVLYATNESLNLISESMDVLYGG